MSTTINITDITNEVTTDSDYNVSGSGYFDDLMETVTKHLEAQRNKSYIDGTDYARAYTSAMNTVLSQSINFALNKSKSEKQADLVAQQVLTEEENTLIKAEQRGIAEDQNFISDATKDYAVDLKLYERNIKEDEEYVSDATKDFKVNLANYQATKTLNEGNYIAEQQTQLIASVGYNNKIRVMNSLADTYGTFGAGGLTMSADMWTTYFTLANDIAGSEIPTSTTVVTV